ncbi:MAG: ATP-binding cassette domain-containing protein, partial [Acidimicrobiia bacterium]
VAFLIILIVLVLKGRGLPLRSHVTDRLPKLGTGIVNVRAIIVAAGILLVLLFSVFNNAWAQATYVSMGSALVVLSVIVLTGYAGQLSLGQFAVAGIGALLAAPLVFRADWPIELAIPVGVLLTIPVGLLFALPALRTRGVNLAVMTLGLGFTLSQVVLANGNWIGNPADGGTNIGVTKFFGYNVQATSYPHRWATVGIIAFILAGLVVANLRRSRTGRRLIAVRTNERAAASLGISVFWVKLYAFGVAAALASLGGILIGFVSTTVTYSNFNIFASINAVSFGVIGGVGYVVGAAMSAPNAIGGLGTELLELLNIGRWDTLVGGAILLLIIIANQDGTAAVATHEMAPLFRKLHLVKPQKPRGALAQSSVETVAPATLVVDNVTVRFGGVVAVDSVSLEVRPGEVVGLIGPNGAGKTTLIDAVTGFVKASTGSVSFNGTAIQDLPASNRSKMGLRRSFQSLELFEDTTIEDNIMAGADSGTAMSWITDLFWPGHHPLPPTAVAAVQQFELEDSLDMLPGELPYGKRRLAGIARAIASAPSIIMLDEPAAGLDDSESRELATLIRSMATERKMGVLLVEHDVGLVMSTCDRIVVLEFGRVIATGTPEQVRNDPAVLAAYLGGSADEGHGSSDSATVRI